MKATQEEINEEIYTILKCIVHSGDNYTRGVVDLNTVAFLERLSKMLHPIQDEIKKVPAKNRLKWEEKHGESFAPPTDITGNETKERKQ